MVMSLRYVAERGYSGVRVSIALFNSAQPILLAALASARLFSAPQSGLPVHQARAVASTLRVVAQVHAQARSRRALPRLFDAMQSWSAEPDLWQSRQRAARERIERNFSIQKMAESYAAVWEV